MMASKASADNRIRPSLSRWAEQRVSILIDNRHGRDQQVDSSGVPRTGQRNIELPRLRPAARRLFRLQKILQQLAIERVTKISNIEGVITHHVVL